MVLLWTKTSTVFHTLLTMNDALIVKQLLDSYWLRKMFKISIQSRNISNRLSNQITYETICTFLYEIKQQECADFPHSTFHKVVIHFHPAGLFTI